MRRRGGLAVPGHLPGDADDACLLMLDDSSEFETIEQLYRELDYR